MWFLTHIRRVGAFRPALLLASLLLYGCSSMPKFDALPAVNVATRSVADIPVPDFDNQGAERPRIASSELTRGIVSAPKPFAWTELGTSAGGRPVQTITIGQGGYRTLILGSFSGHDPAAIALTEKLARHIHENGIILGGIEVSVLRTPNPDGEALRQATNANGVALNRQFPDSSAVPKPLSAEEPEVRLIRTLLDECRPQRVIHIRSYSGDVGAIAASQGATSAAKEVADWLGIQAHVLRFWESKFTQIKPVKRAGGRRYYRPQDMELLSGIKTLLHDQGMTIKGAQKLLREQGVKHVAAINRET